MSDVDLMMKGSRMLTTIRMNRIMEAVTRVSAQLYVKAMIIAATMVALNSMKVPSFSEMPSWRVFAASVMVPAADPGAMESRTWMVCPKRHCR